MQIRRVIIIHATSLFFPFYFDRVQWVHCLTAGCRRAACWSAGRPIRRPSEIIRRLPRCQLIPCGEVTRRNSTGRAAKTPRIRNKFAALCSSPRPLWWWRPYWPSLPSPPTSEVKPPKFNTAGIKLIMPFFVYFSFVIDRLYCRACSYDQPLGRRQM